MSSGFSVFRLENSRTGVNGVVYIIDDKDKVYSQADRWNQPLPSQEAEAVRNAPINDRQQLSPDSKFSTLAEAKVCAFEAYLGKSTHDVLLKKGAMPLAWIVFTQVIYIAILCTPGVYFVGSLYTIVAHSAVLICALTSNAPYMMTASRVSTAVSIGNILLAFLVWQSAYSTLDKVAAAYRTAVVTATAFCIISTNQYLSQLSESPTEGDAAR